MLLPQNLAKLIPWDVETLHCEYALESNTLNVKNVGKCRNICAGRHFVYLLNEPAVKMTRGKLQVHVSTGSPRTGQRKFKKNCFAKNLKKQHVLVIFLIICTTLFVYYIKLNLHQADFRRFPLPFKEEVIGIPVLLCCAALPRWRC